VLAGIKVIYSNAVVPKLFFHMRTPWQPISINCTLHISKMLLINTLAVTSNLYVVTVNKKPNYDLLPPLFNFFSRNPKCPGSYPRLGMAALIDQVTECVRSARLNATRCPVYDHF
jgi:hypothetical protein